MQNNKLIFRSVFCCFLGLFLGLTNVSGQEPAKNVDKESPAVDLKLNTSVEAFQTLILQNLEYKLEKKIEEICGRKYLIEYNNAAKILENAQWVVVVLLGIFPIFLAIFGYLFRQNLYSKINVIETKTMEAQAQLNDKIKEYNGMLELYNRKIRFFEKEVGVRIKAAQARTFYNIAVSNISNGRYEFALQFLLPLYSSRFNFLHVCNHLGKVHRRMGEKQKALEYYEEAKEEAKNQGKDSLVSKFQKDIDEIRSELD